MGRETNYQGELLVGSPHDGTLLGVMADGEAAPKPLRYGVRIGALGLLVPQGVLSEVAEYRPVFAMPHTASWFEGVCNNRGDVAPVFNLHRLLGFDTGVGDKDKDLLLILGQGDDVVAIRIYDYPRPVRGEDRCALPAGVPPQIVEYLDQSCVFNEEVWSDFRHRDFFMALRMRLAVHAQ